MNNEDEHDETHLSPSTKTDDEQEVTQIEFETNGHVGLPGVSQILTFVEFIVVEFIEEQLKIQEELDL